MRKYFQKILQKTRNKREMPTTPPKNFFFHSTEIINSNIGDFSYVGKNSIIHNTKVGKFTSIGPNVVCGYGDHPTNFVSTSPVFYDDMFYIHPEENTFFGKTTVTIGNDVWIGANVFIKNGVNIGHGSIIGAGAVVLKDVPPYSVAFGVPAIIKSSRFDQETINKLIDIAWWDWEIDKIKENIVLIGSANVEYFINVHCNNKNR